MKNSVTEKVLVGILMVVPGFQVMIFKRSLGFFFDDA